MNRFTISKNIGLTKLTKLFEHGFQSFTWMPMFSRLAENQNEALLNAILDLLDSKDSGVFEY